jgi:hypothetical protein
MVNIRSKSVMSSEEEIETPVEVPLKSPHTPKKTL